MPLLGELPVVGIVRRGGVRLESVCLSIVSRVKCQDTDVTGSESEINEMHCLSFRARQV